MCEFWRRFGEVEPFGNEWSRHSEMMSLLDSIYAATINPHLEKKADRHKPRPPETFMPADYEREKKKNAPPLMSQLQQFVKRHTR